MKRKLLIITATVLTLLAVALLTSCGQWDSKYDELDDLGADISVKFLAGEGGMFAGTTGVTVVDVFNADNYEKDADGNVSIPLLAPNDSLRGKEAFEITRNGHMLAGWYIVEPVTNAAGEALDADGNIASVSGKPISYTYTKWDFKNDRLTVKADDERTGNEPSLTLTAMWIPYTNFVFHEVKDGVATEIGTYNGTSLDIPEWDLSTGKLNYKSFAKLTGQTLDGIYLDAALAQPMTEKLIGNMEFGGAENSAPDEINVYTTWRDGEWFKISTVDQLTRNAKASGCYELLADLDFTGKVWPSAFINGIFKGQIEGNGHKITGIKTNAAITSKGDVSHGGVFGTLDSSARISDLTFENVTYTVKSSLSSTALLGLLAGKNNGASLENVSITASEILLTKDFCSSFSAKIKSGDFKMATVFAEGETNGVSASGLTVTLEEGAAPTYEIDENGVITLIYPQG